MKQIFSKAIDKYKALPLPIRASFFFIFCGVFKDAVDVISTPIFTRILTKEEYGLFNVYYSFYSIFRILITLNIAGEAFDVGMARYGEDKERLTSSLQGLLTTLCLVWAAVFLSFRAVASRHLQLPSQLFVLMFLQMLFTSAHGLWFQKTRYRYSYKILTVVTLSCTLLQPVLGILFIRLNHFGFDNGLLRIYAGVGTQIVFGVVFYILQFSRNRTVIDRRYWSFSLRFNLPLLPHYLSQILLNQSDKLMIDAFQGRGYTAVYSVAHSAAFVIQAITNNLNGALIPWFYESLKKKAFKGIRKVTSGLILLSAAIVVSLVLVAPEAMKLLARSEYHDGIWIIPPLAFSVYLIFLYTLLSNLEMYYGKRGFILVSSIIGAATNIILNYIFIPRVGYLAAGYTTVAGYIFMCFGHILFTLRTCRTENVPFSELYDLRLIAVVTVVLFLVCAIIMMLYNHLIIRYLILLIILAVMFVKRDTLKHLITHKQDR